MAKEIEKSDLLFSKTSKTYVDQIFDFIRVYDPNFMAVSPEQTDEEIEEEGNRNKAQFY